MVAAARDGVDQGRELERWPRVADIPFDSNRKLMSTVHTKEGGGWTVFVKGAPDVLLGRCSSTPRGPMTQSDRTRILAANEEMAGKALRVIAVAKRARQIAVEAEQDGMRLTDKPVDLAVQDFVEDKYSIIEPEDLEG